MHMETLRQTRKDDYQETLRKITEKIHRNTETNTERAII